jgi:adenine specific DNA methylase Mod
MVADNIEIEVIERISNGIPVFTVLFNDWVYLITRNKELIQKYIDKKGKYYGIR